MNERGPRISLEPLSIEAVSEELRPVAGYLSERMSTYSSWMSGAEQGVHEMRREGDDMGEHIEMGDIFRFGRKFRAASDAFRSLQLGDTALAFEFLRTSLEDIDRDVAKAETGDISRDYGERWRGLEFLEDSRKRVLTLMALCAQSSKGTAH